MFENRKTLKFNNMIFPFRKIKKKWTDQETKNLLRHVESKGENWKLIAKLIQTKDAKQCKRKHENLVKFNRKGNWTAEEDDILFNWVKNNGTSKWTACAKHIKGRRAKQCRERWLNTLNPYVKKGNWSDEDQVELFNLLKNFFSKWSLISQKMKYRSDNSVKNFFYSSIRRIKNSKFFLIIRFLNLKGTIS